MGRMKVTRTFIQSNKDNRRFEYIHLYGTGLVQQNVLRGQSFEDVSFRREFLVGLC